MKQHIYLITFTLIIFAIIIIVCKCKCKKQAGTSKKCYDGRLGSTTNHSVNLIYTDKYTGNQGTIILPVGSWLFNTLSFPSINMEEPIKITRRKGEPIIYLYTDEGCDNMIDFKNYKALEQYYFPASTLKSIIVDNRNNKMRDDICNLGKYVDCANKKI